MRTKPSPVSKDSSYGREVFRQIRILIAHDWAPRLHFVHLHPAKNTFLSCWNAVGLSPFFLRRILFENLKV